jgi:hypothetical protein
MPWTDALDECPSTFSLSSPHEELLSLLEDLVEEQLPNLRICVTGRPKVGINAILEPLAFRSVLLHDARGQPEGTRDYIGSIVSANEKMQNWSLRHKQLVANVLARAGRMQGIYTLFLDRPHQHMSGRFRWVYCQL